MCGELMKVNLCDSDAQNFAGLLIWRGIKFSVSYDYDMVSDIVFTSDDVKMVKYYRETYGEN